MKSLKRIISIILCLTLACGCAWADNENSLETETDNLYALLNFFGLDDMLYSEAESIESKLLSGELSHTIGDVSRFYKLYFNLLSYKNVPDELDAALLRYLDLLRAFLAQNPFEKLVTEDRTTIITLYDDLPYLLCMTAVDDAAFAETFEALRGYYNEFLMNYVKYADFYELYAQTCFFGTILCEFYSKLLRGESKDDAFKVLEAAECTNPLFEREAYEAYSQPAQMCLNIYRGDIDEAGSKLDYYIEFARYYASLNEVDEAIMVDNFANEAMKFLFAMRMRDAISDDGILSMIDTAKNKLYLGIADTTDAGTDKGFMAGDKILSVNETRIYSNEQLSFIKKSLSDKKGEVAVLRGGETVTLEINPIGGMWGITMVYETENI